MEVFGQVSANRAGLASTVSSVHQAARSKGSPDGRCESLTDHMAGYYPEGACDVECDAGNSVHMYS